MNKIVISGASGFVGTNLLKYLEERGFNNVCKLDRTSLNNIQSVDLKDADIVIHLAGKAHDLRKVNSEKEYYDVNYEITKKLYDCFLQSNAGKFIFISSVKASADSLEGILSEDDVPNPLTHYGKSKLMAEEYISAKILKDKFYYILRPCMIHGPGNKGNLNLLYQIVRKNIPYPLASFENKRSFLSIDNLCFVIKELINGKHIDSGIYNVSDDEALSTNEVVSILSSSLNRKPKLWHLSPSFIRFIARIGDYLHLPLTSERLNKLTEDYVVSNKKLKSAIGENLPTSSKDGLRLTALSFRNT